MALSVNQNTGSQNPSGQSSLQPVGSSTATAQSGPVQTGTPTGLLDSGNGVALRPQPVTTVSLASSNPAVSLPQTKPAQHHLNPVLLILAAVFLVLAVGWFLAIANSGKKHNQYL